MIRNHHLELDNLDSPLVSPSPLTSVGGIPGSAIAEKIFNDPDSWDNPLGPELEGGDPEMAWLTEEVEKLKRLSIDNEREAILSMEQNDLIFRAFPHHYKVTQIQDAPSPPVYEGIKEDMSGPLSLSRAKVNTEKKDDMTGGFTRIWEPRRLRTPPSPLSFSPPSSSEGSEDFNIQLQESSPSSTTPLPMVTPASTTWSFLEWYGIHPESPGKLQVQSAVHQPRKPRPRGILQGSTTGLHVPSQPLTSPPKVPLPPIPVKPVETTVPDRPSSAIRRLPAVPSSSNPLKLRTRSETSSPALSRRTSPAPSRDRRPSEPGTSVQSAKFFTAHRPSDQWSSLPSAIPSASSLRMQSVRSPPPAGPRPKGFAQRGPEFLHRRTASQSPPRTFARPPALNL